MTTSDRDRERDLEAGLARLAGDAVPDTSPVPAPPWQYDGRTPVARRFGRATPWLVAAVLLVLAASGVGAAVTFDAGPSDRAPVGTEPPAPTVAVPTASDSTPEPAGPPSSQPVSTTTTAAPGTASGPVLCTPAVMTFDLGRTDGAAGSSFFSVHATNTSDAPCVTEGFPGVALLDDSGQQILQADRDGSSGTTIVVAPGEEITATLQASSIGDGTTVCPVSPAFLLTLPNNTDSTRIEHVTPGCAVTVGPFTAGDGS